MPKLNAEELEKRSRLIEDTLYSKGYKVKPRFPTEVVNPFALDDADSKKAQKILREHKPHLSQLLIEEAVPRPYEMNLLNSNPYTPEAQFDQSVVEAFEMYQPANAALAKLLAKNASRHRMDDSVLQLLVDKIERVVDSAVLQHTDEVMNYMRTSLAPIDTDKLRMDKNLVPVPQSIVEELDKLGIAIPTPTPNEKLNRGDVLAHIETFKQKRQAERADYNLFDYTPEELASY